MCLTNGFSDGKWRWLRWWTRSFQYSQGEEVLPSPHCSTDRATWNVRKKYLQFHKWHTVHWKEVFKFCLICKEILVVAWPSLGGLASLIICMIWVAMRVFNSRDYWWLSRILVVKLLLLKSFWSSFHFYSRASPLLCFWPFTVTMCLSFIDGSLIELFTF